MPLYEAYWSTRAQGPSFFRTALDQVWDHLLNLSSESVEIEKLRQEAEAAIPDEDDLLPGHLYTQHVAIAVTYALDAWLTGSMRSVVFCLEQAYNVVDSYVLNQILPCGIVTDQIESMVLRQPIVQAELARQSRELDLCRVTEEINWPSILNQMKAEAGQTRILPNA